jgi:2-polyprenyl-3-methyl-5-hydroxy-6-metoxy-1,4-benzoquinol methylase
MKHIHRVENIAMMTPEQIKKHDMRHRSISRIMYTPILKQIDSINPKGVCLEVGAGSGLFTRLFAERFPETRITAIDISKNMAQRALEQVEDTGCADQIEYIICDATDSEVISYLGPFDFICSVYSLHHWDEPLIIMENLIKSLNPGGTIFIGDLRRTGLFSPVHSRRSQSESHLAPYSREELTRIASRLSAREYTINSTFPYVTQSLTIHI